MPGGLVRIVQGIVQIFGENGRTVFVSPFQSLKTSEANLLQGFPFGASLDTNMWTQIAGGGSVTVANSIATLDTTGGANASAFLFHKNKAVFYPAHNNQFTAGIRLSNTGTADNLRAWGLFDGNNGLFFQLAGTTPLVVVRSAGSDNNISSFNGPKAFVIDTDFHVYDIVYSQGSVFFYQDRGLIHSESAASGALVADPHLPLSFANVNINGSTANVELFVRGGSISRLGPLHMQELQNRIFSNSTTVLKVGPGVLRRVVVTQSGLLGNTLTLYDNTAGSGTILTQVNVQNTAIGSIQYDIPFNTGLTAVLGTGTAGQVNVIYG